MKTGTNKTPYYQQAFQMLGGKAITSHYNVSVSTSTAWDINIDEDTSVIRIIAEDSSVLVKYDGTPSTSDFDYVVPLGGALDLYESFAKASTISIIATTSDAIVYINQY